MRHQALITDKNVFRRLWNRHSWCRHS